METKSVIESCLPDINPKQRPYKRSSFLEMWLEEALDSQEPRPELRKTVEVDNTGPLRTVEKF
jgi:hypothetical protein